MINYQPETLHFGIDMFPPDKNHHFETPDITLSPTGSESVTIQSVARCHKWTDQLMNIYIYIYIIFIYLYMHTVFFLTILIGCIAL